MARTTVLPGGARPLFFETPADFGRWLAKHHRSADEVWVGFYKKASGRPSLTWSESVDEALCYGWIDGLTKALDAESFTIRFTPRRKGSNWSTVNLRKVDALIRAGRMRAAGMRAYEARKSMPPGYSFEQRGDVALDPEFEARFKTHPDAWRFFRAQPPGYRRTATWWVVSAKREDTRARRLETLIADSAAGRRIGLLRRREAGEK